MPKNKRVPMTERTPGRAAHPYSNPPTPQPGESQDDTHELATPRTRRSARLQTRKPAAPVSVNDSATPVQNAPRMPRNDASGDDTTLGSGNSSGNDASDDGDVSGSDNTLLTRPCNASQSDDVLHTPTSSVPRLAATSTRHALLVNHAARASSAAPGGQPSSPLTELTSDVEWQTGSAYRVNARSSPRPENSSRREHHFDIPQLTGALASPFAYDRDVTHVPSTSRVLRDITSAVHERVGDAAGQRRSRTPEERLSSTSTSQTVYTQAEEVSGVPPAPRNVSADLRRDVPRDVGSDVPLDVGSDGSRNVEPDVPRDVDANIHHNVGRGGHCDVGSNGNRNVRSDVPLDVETDGDHKVENVVRHDVENIADPDAENNPRHAVEASAHDHAGTNVVSDVKTGVLHDVMEGVRRNGTAEAEGHLVTQYNGGTNTTSNTEGDPLRVTSTAPLPSIHPYYVGQDVHRNDGRDHVPSHPGNLSAPHDAHPHRSAGPYPPYSPLPEALSYAHHDSAGYSQESIDPHSDASVQYEAGADHRGGYPRPRPVRRQQQGVDQQNDRSNNQDEVRPISPRDDGKNVAQNVEWDVSLNVQRTERVDPRFDFRSNVPRGPDIVQAQDDMVNAAPAREHPVDDLRLVSHCIAPAPAALAGPSASAHLHDQGVTLSDLTEDVDDVADDIELDADIDIDAPRVPGRISNENQQILRDAFDSMYEKIKEVSAITGQAKSQVLDQFFATTHTRVHLKHNAWNTYSTYFTANMEAEIAALPNAERVLQEAPFRNSRMVRKACYVAFKARHGAKAYAILDKFRSLEEMVAGQNQTVAQRRTEYRKKFAKLKEMMDSFQTIYGISGAFALLGNVVNSDAALADVYETQDTRGFFESICRTDSDGVIAHLKAHVYNRVSLDNVALAHGDKDVASPNVPGPLPKKASTGRKRATKPSNSQSAKGSSGKANKQDTNSDGDGGADNGDDEDNEVDAKNDDDDDDESDDDDDDDLTIIKDRPKYIIKRFRKMLRAINAGHIISESMFPWKKLLRNFAEGGVVIRNWPEKIPLPPLPKSAKQPAQTKTNSYSRGIAGMPTALQDVFISALRDPDLPLRFERYSGSSSDLLRSRKAVIHGAPPTPTSKHKAGRRVFVNGTVDRQGVPRLLKAPESDAKKTGSKTLASEAKEGDTPSPETAVASVPDAEPAAVSSSQKTRTRQSNPTTSGRRHVTVLIQTTPNRRAPRPPPNPSEILGVESSADSGDEYIPSDSAARPPQGKKRKARQESITLLSSDSGSDSLPAAPFSKRPAADTKGKARADDVGRRTLTPPPSKPHPKTDINERVAPAPTSHGAEDAHRAKQRRVESTEAHNARSGATTVGVQPTRPPSSVPIRTPQDAHNMRPGDLQPAEHPSTTASQAENTDMKPPVGQQHLQNADTTSQLSGRPYGTAGEGPGQEYTIPARGLYVPEGSASGPVVTRVGDQRAMDVDGSSRGPSAASIGTDPNQREYVMQAPPNNHANWYPPSDARVQGNNVPYARDPSGARPPALVTHGTSGGGADSLGQGVPATHTQMRRDLGELPPAQGAHGQRAMFHDEEHAAAPPPPPNYGHYNAGNQYPYGYHYADASPARYPPGMYPPGPYPYQPPSNTYGYPGPAGYSSGFPQPPPPRGDPRYIPSQQGIAHPTSPAVYHPPAPGYANVPPAGVPHRPTAPSSPSWQGAPHHAAAGPALAPPLPMSTPSQQPEAGPGYFDAGERRGGARAP